MLDEHGDLRYGDQVDVVVVGIEPVDGGSFLELERTDGKGTFFIPGNCGAAYTDWTFGSRLRPGAICTATAVPSASPAERISVSILPTVKEHIESAPGVKHQLLFRQQHPFYPATVTGDGAEGGRMTVELVHAERDLGLVHRFEIPTGKVDDGVKNEPGTKVIVAIGADRSRHRRSLPADPDVLDVVARHPDHLTTGKDDEIRPTYAHLPLRVAHDLVAIRDDPAWERDVWQFYLDHHHLEAKEVRIDLPVTGRLTVPPGKNRYIDRNLQSWREQTGCRVNNPDDGQLWTIEGPDEPSVRRFIELARSEARGTTGEVLTSGPPPTPKPTDPTKETTPVDASLEAIVAELRERGIGRQTEEKAAASTERRDLAQKKAPAHIRVHELATKLATDSATILKACNGLGLPKTNALSGLTRNETTKVEAYLRGVSESRTPLTPLSGRPTSPVSVSPGNSTTATKTLGHTRSTASSAAYRLQRRRLNVATLWLILGSALAAPFWHLLQTGELGDIIRSFRAGMRLPDFRPDQQTIITIASIASLALLTFQRSTRWNYPKRTPGRRFPIGWPIIALTAVATLEVLDVDIVPYREYWVTPYSLQWIIWLLFGPAVALLGLILVVTYPFQLRRVRTRFGIGEQPAGAFVIQLLFGLIVTWGVAANTPSVVTWVHEILESNGAPNSASETADDGALSPTHLEPREMQELRPLEYRSLELDPVGPGMSGENVWELQAALEDKGYDLGRVDGVYGPRTEAAVKAFQTDAQLPDTGELDPTTQAVLAAPLGPTTHSLLCSAELGSALDQSGRLVKTLDADGQGEVETLEVRATTDRYVEFTITAASAPLAERTHGGSLRLPTGAVALRATIETVDINGDDQLEATLCASAADATGQRKLSLVVFSRIDGRWEPVLVHPWLEAGTATLIGPRVIVETCEAECWSTVADSYVWSGDGLVHLGKMETADTRSFVEELHDGFTSGDVDQLVTTLHSLVVKAYGSDQCVAYIRDLEAFPARATRIDHTPTLWLWAADDLNIWIGRVATVAVSSDGPSGVLQIGALGSGLRWIADCGEPREP